MATSGSSSYKATDHNNIVFSWQRTSQSIENNTSTIAWQLKLTSDSSGRISSTASKDFTVNVGNAVQAGGNTIGISASSTKTLASGSLTIEHENDGTKKVPYSFSQEMGITFSGSWVGTITGAGTFTLDTIPRKSTLAANNGSLGTAQILTINRHSSSFTHTITYKCGTASGTIATKTASTSVNFTPPVSLASQNTTGTSVTITYTIETFNGSISLGKNTTTAYYAILSSVKPSCAITVSDAAGYASTYGYLKGLSKLKITVTPTLAYGSPIASYIVTVDGKRYTSASVTTDVLTSSGTLTISATVTDKRGYSGSASITISVLDYSAPVINSVTVRRSNSDGEENPNGNYVLALLDATVTSLNNKNTAKYVMEYKATTDSAYTSVSLDHLDGNYDVSGGHIFYADSGKSYNVKFTVTDAFGSTTKTTVVSTGFTLMHWLASGLGMAIGKVAELANVLDIGFQTKFSGGILPVLLVADTDLNDVLTPNTYIGENVASNRYLNCPIDNGTFTLEVFAGGSSGQIKQRLSVCSKEYSRVFERFYYQSTWGDWLCVSDFAGTLLWDGGFYMQASHTIALSEGIDKQPNGIVLVFSRYSSGAVQDYNYNCFFVPKMQVAMHAGKGHQFMMSSDGSFGLMASKYLYINNDMISGHENNVASGTSATGITYDNKGFVLRHVIGV